MAQLIGRQAEQRLLRQWCESGNSEFIVVYGRRRVGKTFLIREMFKDEMAFYFTALSPVETEDKGQLSQQLQNFYSTLKRYGANVEMCPQNWLEAFDYLITFLEAKPESERQVVFLDELPWLDTPRSGFLSAFEHFWNGWGAGRDNLFLVVCGSATSWISDKIMGNRGGLYGRTTHELHLSPFTLNECEQYFKSKNISFSRYDIAQCYMAIGGIPYYLSQFQKGLSLAQNIDKLFFQRGGRLTLEFERIYNSIFSSPENFINVVKVLSQRREGYTRSEISKKAKIKTGGGLSKILEALEVSDFIVSYNYYGKSKREKYYKLIDFYTLFYLRFVYGNKTTNTHYWENNQQSPSIVSWRGLTFELLCYSHIEQLKRAIGIGAVQSEVSPWRYCAESREERGAQIDMLIDRADRVIDLCEMKYTIGDFIIDKAYDIILRNKIQSLITETKCKKTVHPVVVTTYGLRQNEYSGIIQKTVELDDLFDK